MRYITIEVPTNIFAVVGKSGFFVAEPEHCHVKLLENSSIEDLVSETPVLDLLILVQRKLIKIYCEQFDSNKKIDDNKLSYYRAKLEKSEKLLMLYKQAKDFSTLENQIVPGVN